MLMSYFEDVVRWHRAIGDPVEPCPLYGDDLQDNQFEGSKLALGMNLVTEEFQELTAAYTSENVKEMADAGADLVWVVCGLMARMGIDLDAVWNKVRRSNFDKLGGPVRPDGKRLKPEGWAPPNIPDVLLRQRDLYSIR